MGCRTCTPWAEDRLLLESTAPQGPVAVWVGPPPPGLAGAVNALDMLEDGCVSNRMRSGMEGATYGAHPVDLVLGHAIQFELEVARHVDLEKI